MSGQLALYRDEIFNFLRTCTIKFSPFSYIYGRDLIYTYGYTNIEESWNPYYHNLCGEYQSYNTPMYIFAKEDNKEILFEKSLKDTHPRLFEFYKIPSKEHTLLCKKYPSQTHLIKNILYPVDSVQTCIDADELSLLAYDASLLYEYEREDLLSTLRNFLEYVRSRWWTTEFMFEDLYIHAFHYMLWQALPNVLFAQRLYNIGTAAVHPFHVWEYLISKGMQDYRDTLSTKQSLWLYRNLRWVYKNRGKTNTMDVLAKNILREMAITLYGKDMLQNTHESKIDCITVPEIISLDITENVQKSDTSTIEQMNLRLYESELDHDISETYVEKLVENYGRTTVNTLPTKLLEMKKNYINTMWEDMLANFLFQSTIYRYIEGQLNYSINFNDKVSSSYLQLPIADALALLYYLSYKQNNDTPVRLPTIFSTYIPYKKEYPKNIPTTFKFFGTNYRIKQFIDVDGIMRDIPFTDEVFVDQNSFSDLLTKQFTTLLRDVRYVRSNGNDLHVRAMETLYQALHVKQTHSISLSPYTDYDKWLNADSHIEIKKMLDFYTTNNVDYGTLVKNLLSVVFPITEGMAALIGSTEYLDKLYSSLKSLFVQLCSYNVVFLDTSREKNEYIILSNMKGHMEPHVHREGTLRYEFDIRVDDILNINTPLKVVTDLNRVGISQTQLDTRLDIEDTLAISLSQALKRTINVKTGITTYLISEGTV